MSLKINSYRGFLIKIFLSFLIIIFVLTILMLCGFIYYPKDMKNTLPVLILFLALDIVLFIGIIVLKFYKGKSYIFTFNEISIYNKGKFIEKIVINEIESISYRSFKFRYLITIFFGELIEGGVWKLYIKLKNGNIKVLSLFSVADVKKIKDLYGEIVQIL